MFILWVKSNRLEEVDIGTGLVGRNVHPEKPTDVYVTKEEVAWFKNEDEFHKYCDTRISPAITGGIIVVDFARFGATLTPELIPWKKKPEVKPKYQKFNPKKYSEIRPVLLDDNYLNKQFNMDF